MTEKTIKIKGIEKLLDEQTSVILSAVDEKLGTNKIEIVSSIDQKLAKMETRMSQKFDKLITTLDRFLKRLTDIEDEFEMMKLDINRLKKIIKEKLGVNLL